MRLDLIPLDDPEGYIRRVGLNTRDQNLARQVHFTPDELAANAAQEAALASSNITELDAAIANAATPRIRATLQAERDKLGTPTLDLQPLDLQPLGASQADVRKSEPRNTPLQNQEEQEAKFAQRMVEWRAATGGRLAPDQTVRQAVAEYAGMVDPQERQADTDFQHLAETGELTPSDSVAYMAGKGLAQTVGAVTGGPAGALGAGGLVDVVVLSTRLHQGVQGGAITEDQAAEIMLKELVKRTGLDAAVLFGLPIVGQIVARVPGVRGIMTKAAELAGRGAAAAKAGLPGGRVAPRGAAGTADEGLDIAVREQAAARAAVEEEARRARPATREAKLEKLAGQATTPEAREAVGRIGARTEEVIPSPAAITGYASGSEAAARRSKPEYFERSRVAIEAATEAERKAMTDIGMTRQQFGETTMGMAKTAEKAVKARLRPVFERAAQANVAVDMANVIGVAENALARDAGTAGGKLLPSEAAKLRKIVAGLFDEATETPRPQGAEAALDFISARKADARQLTAEGAPTEYFKTVVDDMVRAADQAYMTSIAGKGDLAKKLVAARRDYRHMNETIFDDAFKVAARKNPENVGKLLWGGSQVSNAQQFNKMLAIGVREGKLSVGQYNEMRAKLAKGFLSEAMNSPAAAANWTESLAKDRAKAEMWAALTKGKGGAELRHLAEVVEEMGKISMRAPVAAGRDPVPLMHAEGRGAAALTGTNQLGFVAWAAGAARLSNLAATAYTQGNKGVLNALAVALGPKTANTAAGTAASAYVLKWWADQDQEESQDGPE